MMQQLLLPLCLLCLCTQSSVSLLQLSLSKRIPKELAPSFLSSSAVRQTRNDLWSLSNSKNQCSHNNNNNNNEQEDQPLRAANKLSWHNKAAASILSRRRWLVLLTTTTTVAGATGSASVASAAVKDDREDNSNSNDKDADTAGDTGLGTTATGRWPEAPSPLSGLGGSSSSLTLPAVTSSSTEPSSIRSDVDGGGLSDFEQAIQAAAQNKRRIINPLTH